GGSSQRVVRLLAAEAAIGVDAKGPKMFAGGIADNERAFVRPEDQALGRRNAFSHQPLLAVDDDVNGMLIGQSEVDRAAAGFDAVAGGKFAARPSTSRNIRGFAFTACQFSPSIRICESGESCAEAAFVRHKRQSTMPMWCSPYQRGRL